MITNVFQDSRLQGVKLLVFVALGTALLLFASRRFSHSILDLILSVVAAIVLVICTDRLGLGVALVPFTCASVPFYLSTGSQSVVVAGLLLTIFLLAVWVARSLLRRSLTLLASPVNGPVLALMFLWTLSYAYGQVVRPPLAWVSTTFHITQAGGLAVFLLSVALLLLAANVGHETHWIKIATWGLVAVGIYGAAEFHLKQQGITLTSTFLNVSGLFTLWVVCMSFSQALFNEQLSGRARIGLLVLTAAWLHKAMFVETLWLSGWLPPAIALTVIVALKSKRLFVVAALLTTMAVAQNFDQVYNAVFESNLEEGSGTRVDIAEQAGQVFLKHPFFGTGPAGYAVDYVNYYRDSQFSMSTHSNYIDIALETGVVGSLVFAWFLYTLAKIGRQACRQWTSGFEGAFARGALGGLAGVLVAMSLGDWFIPFVYNQTIGGFRHTAHSWVFLGFLVSLAAVSPQSREG